MRNCAMAKRCYRFGGKVGVDEDECHEFKSHRTLCYDEMALWTTEENDDQDQILQSRQPVSKTVNALLNTGRGGIAYLGISNDGEVTGLRMTMYQKDHVIVSLYDMLERFTPKVDKDQVLVDFIHVLPENEPESPKEAIEHQAIDETDERRWKKPHVMRTANYCWCDKDALARYNMGLLPLSYVVELTVKPWDGVRNPRCGVLPPIYQDERGIAYIRRLASNVQIGLQEVVIMTKNQLHNYYEVETNKLEKELDGLQKRVAEKFTAQASPK